MMSDELSWNPS